MDDRTYNVWANLLAGSALVVVTALMMVAIVWGMPRDDAAVQRSATQTPTAQADQVQAPATGITPTVTIPPTMTQLHEAMLDQMRVGVAQPMLDQMSRDTMWRLMVTGELRAMEAIEKGLDQMLAR